MKVYYFHTTDGHSIPEISEGEFIKERDNYLTVREGDVYEHFVINSFFRFFYDKEEAEEAWRTYACNVVMRLETLLRDAREKQLRGPIVKNE
jgi:hypothetical protein